MPTAIKSQQRALAAENIRWPATLREIPPHDWPDSVRSSRRQPLRVLRSRTFFAQVFDAPDDHLRLTVNRTRLADDGRYRAGITWDDLQQLKREAGYGAWWAVEIYPADAAVVNEAPMRHLWLSQRAVAFAWGVRA